MGCGCGGRKNGAPQTWIHTDPNGRKTSYSSEMDARMAASRDGGTVRAG